AAAGAGCGLVERDVMVNSCSKDQDRAITASGPSVRRPWFSVLTPCENCGLTGGEGSAISTGSRPKLAAQIMVSPDFIRSKAMTLGGVSCKTCSAALRSIGSDLRHRNSLRTKCKTE